MPRLEKHGTTDHRFAIDLAELHRHSAGRGEIRWMFGGETYGHAHWTLRREHLEVVTWIDGDPFTHKIGLSRTAAGFGGERSWLCCPGCLCRCRVIYLGHAGYRCRKCYNLTYPSQRVSRRFRDVAAAQRCRIRLGGSGNLLEPFPDRPKGMHHSTYLQIERRDRELWGA